MNLKSKFRWKELSEDGLLKDPKEYGPYYSRSGLNSYGYDSKEEALEDLLNNKEGYKYDELVLIETVSFVR